MVINLNNFILQEYNYNNIDHRSVVIEFTNDKESSKYLGDLFYSIEEINKRKNNNNINFAFVVYRKNIPVGYISIITKESIYEISYGIIPRYRSNGLGTLLLQEFSDYLFHKYTYIDQLSLIIAKDNIISKKTAISAGYYQENKNKYCIKYKK